MSSEFDEHAAGYARAVNDAIDFSGMDVEHFVRGKAEHLARFLPAAGLGPEARVLDVGCGVGQYERLLGGRFALTGVDTSARSVEEAARSAPEARFEAYSGERLPFADATFDAAFTICVVHHVPLEVRPNFLREVRRVLKPGAPFLVYEHNPWNPLTRWAVERCVFDKDAILLSPPWARRWLREGGFEAVRSEFLFTLPPLNETLTRADRLVRALPTGAQYVAIGRRS